jgi:hypothetical protein
MLTASLERGERDISVSDGEVCSIYLDWSSELEGLNVFVSPVEQWIIETKATCLPPRGPHLHYIVAAQLRCGEMLVCETRNSLGDSVYRTWKVAVRNDLQLTSVKNALHWFS